VNGIIHHEAREVRKREFIILVFSFVRFVPFVVESDSGSPHKILGS
jgi:hypothetical protein